MRIGPLVVAALLLAGLIWRRQRMSTENKLLALAAIVALSVYGSGVKLPDFEKLILDLGEALGSYTYILVGVMSFLEVGAFVGLIAPGEFTVIFGGVVAGQGRIDIIILIGITWACAVAGDSFSFFMGRRLGRGFLVKHGPKVKMTEERLEQVEGFFDRHGGKTILIGRFVGLVRAMAPFIAGASKMPFGRFFPVDVIAAGLWSTVFCLLGYIFWQSFSQVVDIAKQGAFALGTVITLVIGGIAAYRYLRVPENRVRAHAWLDEQAERPLLRPVAAVLRPLYRNVLAPFGRRVAGPLRFLWDRLTPGGLGLEFTTLLAVLSVGSFAFIGWTVLASHELVSYASDRRAFSWAASLNDPTGVDIATAVSHLGSLLIVAPLMLIVILYLALRREALEAITLGVASVLTYAGVHITKAAVDRDRPLGALIDTTGSSFPSGHAAYSVFWVAAAVAILHAFPSLLYRAAVVTVAIAIAALVGLSRVYLRAHHLSDVVAGWGLGASLFALSGTVVLLVSFFRQNRRPS